MIPLALLLFMTVSGFHFPSNLRTLTTVTKCYKPCLSPTVSQWQNTPPFATLPSTTVNPQPSKHHMQPSQYTHWSSIDELDCPRLWESLLLDWLALSYSYLLADKNFGKLVACEVSLVSNNLWFMLILYWHITSVLSPWFTSPIAR